jgi:hypothetical protein
LENKNTRVIARSKVDGMLILNGTDDERMSGVFSGRGEARVPEDRLQWQAAAVPTKNV